MLIIDRISVLFESKETIINSCRILYDIYLYRKKNAQVDRAVLLKCMKQKNIDLSKKSEFEVLVDDNNIEFYEELERFVKVALNTEISEDKALSADIIINEIIWLLDFFREKILENCELPERILYTSKILGRSANEIHGWTYPIAGGSKISVYTSCEARDGLVTCLRRFIFLDNYNTKNGFLISGLPTAERVICDYLSYPDRLCADMYLCEALEGYIEEHENFSAVYDLMQILKIDKGKLQIYIKKMYIGCE